ncbi:MAG: MFS transporter [Deltaproteobacteria bacterium]|nr:MFS transporter [Deltaproteobacteria bacterium]
MPGHNSAESRRGVSLFKSIGEMAGNSRTAGILLARYATMIIMVPTMAFLPLLMSNWPTHTGLQVGTVIACRTLINAVLQVPFGKCADRYNKVVLLLVGSLCMGLAVLAIPSMENFLSMTILYVILGMGEAVIWPVLGAYATEEGRTHYGQGTMMGMFSFAMSGGVFTGAVLAGMSMDLAGIKWAYYTCGVMVLLLVLVAAKMIRSGEAEATAADKS